MTLTINMNEPLLEQLRDQNYPLTKGQKLAVVHLDKTDQEIIDLVETGLITDAQGAAARKKLLKRVLFVLGGGRL